MKQNTSLYHWSWKMIHRALKLLRKYHQLTQIELSKRLGISNSYLSEIENGEKQPSLELLSRYASIFKIPVSSIILFSETMLSEDGAPRGKLKIAAADKILRILEWIDERNDIQKDT